MPEQEQLSQEIDEARLVVKAALSRVRNVAERVGRGAGGREMSLAIARIQESEHWLRDAIDEVAVQPERSDGQGGEP